MRARKVYTFPFDVERGNSSVEYIAEFTITPAEPVIMWGDNAHPGSAAEVDDVRVYVVTRQRCPTHRFLWTGCAECRDCKNVKERRPELDCLVDEEELLEFARGQDTDDDDHAYEAARDEYRAARGDYR